MAVPPSSSTSNLSVNLQVQVKLLEKSSSKPASDVECPIITQSASLDEVNPTSQNSEVIYLSTLFGNLIVECNEQLNDTYPVIIYGSKLTILFLSNEDEFPVITKALRLDIGREEAYGSGKKLILTKEEVLPFIEKVLNYTDSDRLINWISSQMSINTSFKNLVIKG